MALISQGLAMEQVRIQAAEPKRRPAVNTIIWAACWTPRADVSFSVGGEMFRAHRAVLAAWSPVFKEELFGSGSRKSETTQRVTVQDTDPVTFGALLRFAYTDSLAPTGRELLGENPLMVGLFGVCWLQPTGMRWTG
ncbi:BTB/POZ and MATH domain-containing protein 3-like [Brachypodium distachyon]|uniref:BTB domain-containing protein n=1 Tax=Brachypodium distachyon TaxID=15368 RepID=A0A2K2D2E3_BRADI|nr:BTB/POZ and MATH domain-containing protein 3-like [Brachypodium distachyon]PNT68449.1 hypothetical protein BRADI_3g40733v3 [Brachypodium distachyon]|eukprot:XP_024318279.1 BTB/POZ and MATH domain-containing protein 3-like [Brachypodium distachyon]